MLNIQTIVKYIENSTPFIFLKFGDGEYLCASKNFNINNNNNNTNCDNDTYTKKLSNSLNESFKYLVNNTQNTYYGKWHDSVVSNYWESIVNKPINWVDYWTLLIYCNDINKLEIYKTIKNSKQKKIYVCNELIKKVEILLNIDDMVYVPLNNWFDDKFEDILNKIKNIIGKEDEKFILMTSCGMSAKVLVTELYKIYPNGIYLDIGSGLDTICTKRSTRGLMIDYNFCYNFFKDILPDNWNDPKYDYIYPEAQNELGLHLPKNNI
jgi:hypothetical protein